MKKIVCILLVFAAFFQSFAVSAESNKEGKIYPLIPAVDKYYDEAKDYIAQCLRERKTTIDISAYDVSVPDMMYVFKAAVFDNPDIFYVNASYIEYKFSKAENKVYYISPVYIFKKSKIPDYIKKFNSAALSLTDGINPSWSDYRKALVLHDRLAVHCEYKYQNVKSYTAYSAFVTRKSVCEGYARAYSYLLSLTGVDSKIINVESIKHCWNMVKLSGKWYHVDVTADDPTPDTAGYVRHNFFLCSDKKIKSYKDEQHVGWKNDITYNSEYKCSGYKYDSAYFRKITSQIVYDNGAFYYMDNNFKGKGKAALVRRGASVKAVKYITDNWYRIGYNAFPKLCERDGYIYYTAKRTVYRMKISSGKIKRVFDMPSFWKDSFYGIKSQGDYIYAVRKNEEFAKKSPFRLLKISSKNKILQMPFLKYGKLTMKNKSSAVLKVYRGSGNSMYTSSNSKVAKVNSKGRIRALKKGSCTITVVRNGKTMKCKITVTGKNQ